METLKDKALSLLQNPVLSIGIIDQSLKDVIDKATGEDLTELISYLESLIKEQQGKIGSANLLARQELVRLKLERDLIGKKHKPSF